VLGGDGKDRSSPFTEVLDFSGKSNVRCPSIPSIRTPRTGFTAAYVNGRVISCGGLDPSLIDDYPECYALGPDLSKWEYIGYLSGVSHGFASSVVNGKWVITGGADIRGHSSTAVTVFDGFHFHTEFRMPSTRLHHCQLTINSTSFLIADGKEGTYLFNFETEVWETLDDLRNAEENYLCSLITDRRDNINSLAAYVGRRNDIYSFSSNSWIEKAPPVPNGIELQASAPVRNGILSIGGMVDGKPTNATYKFDEFLFDWVLTPVELKTARHSAVAVPVPDNFLNCS